MTLAPGRDRTSGLQPTRQARRQPPAALRPWSALVCGVPGDRTLLVVDWLVLACARVGLVATAMPIGGDGGMPHAMYVEVAGHPDVESSLSGVPWGAVDLVVAGEHLELVRALRAGFIDAQATTVVASSRRSLAPIERATAPQHVLREREVDALVAAAARSYCAFDAPEVAGWYGLPPTAQPGLLLGAVCGSGVTGLPEAALRAAVDELGIDAGVQREAFRRGTRMGRHRGGRVRRRTTAYQFTRRRRSSVPWQSRQVFEQLVERIAESVDADDVSTAQHAVFRLVQFQDVAWAERFVVHVEDVARAENLLLDQLPAEGRPPSIVPEVIRSLVALMVWPDAPWVARRKLLPERLKALRAEHALGRFDAWELREWLPFDADDRALVAPRWLPAARAPQPVPAILQSVQVRAISTLTPRGARRLQALARASRQRNGSARQREEIATVETFLEALHDTLRRDHGIARIVARSGGLVQGSGAVRDASRASATAFWGRVVRPACAVDDASPDGVPRVAMLVVPFVWQALCRSGPLALWEHAGQVLGIALAHARGASWTQCHEWADDLCRGERPPL